MPRIEPHIKNYIDKAVTSVENRLDKRLGERFDKRVDKAINKAKKEFSSEMKRYNSELFEKYNDEIKRHTAALVEDTNNRAREIGIVASHLPSEEKIRAIFREEIQPFDVKLGLCINEIGQINTKLDYHERRIRQLEDSRPA